jgi:maltose O-acetyltransferase
MRFFLYLNQKIKFLKKRYRFAYNNAVLFKQLGSVGYGTEFKGRFYVSKPKKLFIGKNVHIGDNVFLKTDGEINIGDNCHFSRNITIYSVNHNYEGSLLPYDYTTTKKKVTIGKNVWLGMNVNIIPGVTVGDGAIIGMGSTVTKDVPPLAIVGGNPAKVLKFRDKEHYDNLEKAGLYGDRSGRLFKQNKAK